MLIGYDQKMRGFFLEVENLLRHAYILGLIGMGKTTFLLVLAVAIIQRKLGSVIFIDPHGDASHQLAQMVDAVVFDPTCTNLGLNIFHIPDPKRMDDTADWAAAALRKSTASDYTWPMTADRMARHLFFALAPHGGTLLDVPRFLKDRLWRTQLLRDANEVTRAYWEDFNLLGKDQAAEAGPIVKSRAIMYQAGSARLYQPQSAKVYQVWSARLYRAGWMR